MNKVRLILTMVVIFILANLLGFFIHAIWLKPDYYGRKQVSSDPTARKRWYRSFWPTSLSRSAPSGFMPMACKISRC